MKILVVEDDFSSRTLLAEMLREYGTVHVAVNGQEAMEAVTESFDMREPYQLVCLDIVMPEVDGHGVLQFIRNTEAEYIGQRERVTRILMTTALRDGENIFKAFREQCDGYLVKPFNESKLIAQLEEFELL